MIRDEVSVSTTSSVVVKSLSARHQQALGGNRAAMPARVESRQVKMFSPDFLPVSMSLDEVSVSMTSSVGKIIPCSPDPGEMERAIKAAIKARWPRGPRSAEIVPVWFRRGVRSHAQPPWS